MEVKKVFFFGESGAELGTNLIGSTVGWVTACPATYPSLSGVNLHEILGGRSEW